MAAQKLVGHEKMATFTTEAGNVWCVSRSGRYAWPLWGEATPFEPYGPGVAEVRGQEVDATIPEDDYRVRGAGPDWREVYDHLSAALATA